MSQMLACLVASSALLVSTLAVAAPPEEPGGTVNEPVPVPVPVPTEAESSSQALPPAEPEAPPPTSEPSVEAPESEPPLPSWDAELPSYEGVPEADPNEPEIPRDGLGSTVAGAMLFTGGLVLASSSGVLLALDDEPGLWVAGGVLSGAALSSGIILLITGTLTHKRYEPWRQQHQAPARGTGMLAGGTLAVSAGALGMLLGAISLPRQDADDLPYGEVVLSLGTASVTTGIVLLAVGLQRRKRFQIWNNTRLSPSFGLLPSPQLRPAGATFAVTGRF